MNFLWKIKDLLRTKIQYRFPVASCWPNIVSHADQTLIIILVNRHTLVNDNIRVMPKYCANMMSPRNMTKLMSHIHCMKCLLTARTSIPTNPFHDPFTKVPNAPFHSITYSKLKKVQKSFLEQIYLCQNYVKLHFSAIQITIWWANPSTWLMFVPTYLMIIYGLAFVSSMRSSFKI